MSRLELILWGADFMIGGVGYLTNGIYAGVLCFLIGGVLILIALYRKDESQAKLPKVILVDARNRPYEVSSRIKKWHTWGLTIFISGVIILVAYGLLRHTSKDREPTNSPSRQNNGQLSSSNDPIGHFDDIPADKLTLHDLFMHDFSHEDNTDKIGGGWTLAARKTETGLHVSKWIQTLSTCSFLFPSLRTFTTYALIWLSFMLEH